MKLAVFGGTGRTGLEIVTQALVAGNHVTAVARDPALLQIFQSKDIRIVKGDSLSMSVADEATHGKDAVLSALGHVRGSPPNLLAMSIMNIMESMKKQNVTRLVVLTNVAARDPTDSPGLYNRVLLMLLTLFREQMAWDTANESRLISESTLDWTIVRANLLTNGPLTKKYRVGQFDRNAGTRVSRADVADFMISCAVENKYVRARPLISE